MAGVEIKKISYTHEAMINWLISNPDRYLKDAAAYFGVTQPWLSTIINSDIFQAKLKERQDAVFASVASGIPEKLRACADIALERLAEKLTVVDDPELLLDASDKLLGRMGYSPAKASTVINNNTQVNTYSVSSEVLAQARERARLSAAQAPLLGQPLPQQENVPVPIDQPSAA